MLPDSNTRTDLPSVKVSVRAGIRPFGLTVLASDSKICKIEEHSWDHWESRTVQKPLFLLSVLGDVDLGEIVRQTEANDT